MGDPFTIHSRRLPLYQCRMCRRQTTLTAGTYLENTRTSLSKWKTTIELLSTPQSVNAVQLSSIIDVTYKTAFSMLKKIRAALTDVDREVRLTGHVHSGFSFYNLNLDSVSRYYDKRTPIFLAGSLCLNGDISYLKIKPTTIKKLTTSSGDREFLDRHVDQERSTYVYHKSRNIPSFTRLIWQLRRWIGPTFRGISLKYSEHYLDEFSFRVNRSSHPSKATYDLCAILMRNGGCSNLFANAA